jgi:dTDP-4-amino-4,6-dideoxygalactose transaminase
MTKADESEGRSHTCNLQLPLAKPYFDSEELTNIKKVLDSGWVTQGPAVRQLEAEFAKYVGAKYAIAVVNCTAALHLAMLAIDIKENDEVLVADFTFPATGHSVLYCRGSPRFVDVDPKTYNIDTGLIEDMVTDRTKAIVPVHTFGQPVAMDEVMDIARRHGLKVIEDAACAHGARYKGRFAGTIGDIGCFSFHARKGMTTGEGGMIVTNDRELADKMRNLSVFGMVTAWEREDAEEVVIPVFKDVGYNYKLSDIAAAVGLAQLKKLEGIIERKIELAHHMNEILSGIDHITPPYAGRNVKHVYQSYVALVDRGVNRNKLIMLLRKEGIQAQIGTYASHVQPVYNSTQKCPVSLDIFNRSLALPFYYELERDDIDRMGVKLGKALEAAR